MKESQSALIVLLVVSKYTLLSLSVCVCVCVCACVHACVRACVRACVCVCELIYMVYEDTHLYNNMGITT